MHRFYLSPEHWDPSALTLRGTEAHHARDVLRMKRGERAVLFNGRGREVTAEVVDLARDELRLRKLHETETPRSEEHTSELQSPCNLVCRLLLEKKKNT